MISLKSLSARLYRCIPPAVARALLRRINTRFIVSAAGLFQDRNGKILLARHVFRHQYPWGLPGGFLTAGETPEQGVLRELQEELGLAGKIDRVVATNLVSPRHLEVIVRGTVDGNQPLRFNREIFEAGYFDAAHLPQDMPPAHRDAIVKLRAR